MWLGGLLAGLNSRLLEQPSEQVPAEAARAPLTVLYGTQTGNAEAVANEAAASARAPGFDPRVLELDAIEPAALAQIERLIVVCSPHGEGERPDNAQLFWKALTAETAPRLESLSFAVLVLGDTGYDGFCQAAKLIDMRLEQLGAKRVAARADCDVDYETTASAWIEAALPALPNAKGGPAPPSPPSIVVETAPRKSEWIWLRRADRRDWLRSAARELLEPYRSTTAAVDTLRQV